MSTPRATPGWVGRDSELARIVARAVDPASAEAVFVICGVAGIGKTELAIRALDEVGRARGWRDPRSVAISLPPGADAAHALAALREACRIAERPEPANTLEAALAPIIDALEVQPTLLRIDDLHHLADAEAGALIGTLTRHLRSTCAVATSRKELAIPPPNPAACVTRLAPLPAADARRMVELLADTLDLGAVDAVAIAERAGGSPFYIRHEVAALAGGPASSVRDVLDQALRQLDAPARTLLLRASVTEVAFERAAIAPIGDPAFAALVHRLWIDVREGVVRPHDLVRDAVCRTAAPDEIRAAYAWAAAAQRARFETAPGTHVMHGLEALRLLRAAGDRGGALGFLLAHHRTFSRAGLDHRLLEALVALRGDPATDFAIDLARAHVLLRLSRIAEARALLGELAGDPCAQASTIYHGLASSVAMRTGDLRAVEASLRAALALPASERQRQRIALYLADLHAIRGFAALATGLAGPPPADPTTGAAARWVRSRAIAMIFDQRHADAAAVAAAHRTAVAPRVLDLDVQIAMLEVVALTELGAADAAQALVASHLLPAARSGALREKVARCYAGLAAWAAGDLAAAERDLAAVLAYLATHRDDVLGGIVAHYLGRVRLAAGDPAAALPLLAATAARSAEMGFALAPLAHTYAALAQLELGALATAADMLAAVHASGLAGPARAFVAAVGVRLAVARGEPADAAALTDDLDRAELAHDAEAARRALDHHAAHGARGLAARAALALAICHARAGGRADRVIAREALARAQPLVDPGLAARAVVVAAALDPATADDRLATALAASLTTARGHALLRAALERRASPALSAPDRALLADLGLLDAPAARPDLLVDLATSSIANAAGTRVRGRPMLCELLARLVEADGQPVEAAALYCAVWSAPAYHPLRHRNTLYAAINRLRGVLAPLFPEHAELIATGPSGWSLRRDLVTARVVRPA